jgi:hypothetical protein
MAKNLREIDGLDPQLKNTDSYFSGLCIITGLVLFLPLFFLGIDFSPFSLFMIDCLFFQALLFFYGFFGVFIHNI